MLMQVGLTGGRCFELPLGIVFVDLGFLPGAEG